MNMTPQSKPIEQESTEERVPGEEFARQVEDHSLPAQEILTKQQEGRAANEAPALFVP
jgi:hypothetical protein